MTNSSNKKPDTDSLQVFEGLLNLCSQREKEIADLCLENLDLMKQIKNLQSKISEYKEMLESSPLSKPESSIIESAPHHEVTYEESEDKDFSDLWNIDKPAVLIGEQSRLLRKNLQELFQALGFRIGLATGSGRRIVENFIKEKPKLVTLDLELKDAAGIDVIRLLKRIEPEAKIMVICKRILKDEVELLKEAGALDCVFKPVIADHLISSLKEHSCYANPKSAGRKNVRP
ncbi:MAG TPA: response regulator [bacterium]